MRKSKVALKRSLRIAVEKRVRVNLSCALAVVCATELKRLGDILTVFESVCMYRIK